MAKIEQPRLDTLLIENETPEEFQARKFEGVSYVKRFTNLAHTEFEILCADKGMTYPADPNQALYQEWLSLGNVPAEIAYIEPAYPYGLEDWEPGKRMRAVFWMLVKERYGLEEQEAKERLFDALADPSTPQATQILNVRRNLTAEVQQMETDYQASLGA